MGTMSIKQFNSKHKKTISIAAAMLFCIVAVMLVAGCLKVQITPREYRNTYWESEDSVLSIYIPELPTEDAPVAKKNEGELRLEENSIRIYVDWEAGSQVCTIFDADKFDSGLCYRNEDILIIGSGHWTLNGEYVIDIDTDNVGLNTDRIVLERKS